MENISKEKMVEELEKRLSLVNEQLKLEEIPCIKAHNWVAKVGAYTIGTNEKGVVELQIKDIPQVWTKKGIEEIRKMTFSNPRGKVNVEVVSFKEYLNTLKSELEQVLKLLK